MLSKLNQSFIFSSSYLVLVLSALGIHFGSFYNLTGVFLLFIFIPAIEFLFPNLKIQQKPKSNFMTDLWIFISPVSLTIILIYAGLKYTDLASTSEKWGLVLTVGSLTGTLGITAAHELIHRKEPWQRALGVWNLMLVNFGHWGVEHVFGHHKSVGTTDDHASAIKGKWLYTFWFEDYFGGLFNSFIFEKKRIEGKSFSFFRNRIINYFAISLLISTALFFIKPILLGFWWGQSLVAVLLLLTVDYIEHYGLRRSKKENGVYEPVSIQHSWDTEAFLTNALLFNLGLHSHHHMKARVTYQELLPQQNAKVLPYGYSVMVMLAFIPPLYHRKMDSRL